MVLEPWLKSNLEEANLFEAILLVRVLSNNLKIILMKKITNTIWRTKCVPKEAKICLRSNLSYEEGQSPRLRIEIHLLVGLNIPRLGHRLSEEGYK